MYLSPLKHKALHVTKELYLTKTKKELYLTCLLLPLEVVSPWPMIGSPMASTTLVFEQIMNINTNEYSQTCIKRSPSGNGLNTGCTEIIHVKHNENDVL